jgi:ABC-type multidrug transport system fused ATPase/permease subunit
MKEIFKTVRRARRTYETLAPYGRPYRRRLIEGTLATLLLVACRLAFPWPLRGLMEIVFHKGSRGRGATVAALVPHTGDPVWWLTGSFVMIILLWGVSESLQRLAFTRFAVGLVRDTRASALGQLPRTAENRVAGDLIAAVTGDAARVKSGVKTILIGTSRNGAFFVGVTIIVSLIDPLIGLVFLAGGIATVIVGALGAWRSSRIARRSRRREGTLTDDLHRYFAGTAELPEPGGDPERSPDSKVTRVEGITTFTVHAVLAATTSAILILAIQAGRSGRLSAGSVFTILAYILLMHNKTVGFGRRIIRGGRLLPSAERVASLVAVNDGKPLLPNVTQPTSPKEQETAPPDPHDPSGAPTPAAAE